ncbi:ArsA family ATPase [Streptomyces sp. N2-109]|uniref:ArsA family ATPase n=1 Tax=Streptomyces gossypii TaxID=2883101 RepID=A0ABT2JZL3_9ACTN|nr:ArsA-related P-loop ATPase [Streptomyces gossypii]MCT2593347.1 ArsA family ATPase [Streptomyces gossypii]
MNDEADTGTAAGPGTRTLLVTGSGGAGRTTVAAATALAAARQGSRVLLLSAEPRSVLEAVLGTPLDPAGTSRVPVAGAGGLWVTRADADEEFRAQVTQLQERGRAALELTGAEPLDADELTPLPGAEAFALLRALCGDRLDGAAHAARSPLGAPWDLVVADLPPVRQALGLLALPEQLRRYLRRLLPPEKQAARALRPLLAQLAGVPIPAQVLYATAARWDAELARAQRVIGAPGTSVRLVTEPGSGAPDAVRAARAGCALYGLRVDAVLANRVLPTGSTDDWLAGLSGQQQSVLKDLRAADGAAYGAALCELPHLGRDPRGPADLALLAPPPDLPYGPCGPAAPAEPSAPAVPPGPVVRPLPGGAVLGEVTDQIAEDGLLHWLLPLPGAARETLELVRRGDELIVGVGPYRRLLPLPSALRRCRVVGAALAEGVLRVRFAPEPGLWPS